ncbi:MAG: class I SAM-dependent RNA methyltransferase [Roseobacter sp.]
MAEFTIHRLGLLGDGIAEGPVYVSRALPGERVEGQLKGQNLEDIKILTPSERRVSPECRHFKSCGGCSMQHADDEFVADWKLDIVKTALSAHGLDTEFRPVKTSPARSRRRAGFAARRTKKGAMVGFHGRASGTIVPIPECQLVAPEVLAGVPVAEELAIVGASRKAALSVMVTLSDVGLDVAVRQGKPLDGPLRQRLAMICDSTGIARLTWDDEVVAMRASPVHSFANACVVPPPGSFLQATAHGEQVLTQAVCEITDGASRVIDLFSGCGTFALPLSSGAEVHAVEGDGTMLAALDAGWRHAKGVKTVTTERRDLFRRPLMFDEMTKADAVVIDPPRAGAEAQIAELARSSVPVIAYVSCNPVTFARDAAVLCAAGYHLEWIQVVDQFRWSAHVELAACLTAPKAR